MKRNAHQKDWKSMTYIRVNQSLIQILFSNNILYTFPCKWHGQKELMHICIFSNSICVLSLGSLVFFLKESFLRCQLFQNFLTAYWTHHFYETGNKEFSCLQRWCTSFWFRVFIWIVFSIGGWDIFHLSGICFFSFYYVGGKSILRI